MQWAPSHRLPPMFCTTCKIQFYNNTHLRICQHQKYAFEYLGEAMTIGNRVLQILDKKGLNQKDLADYLHTSPSTVNGWKGTKSPKSDYIIPICEFLGVSANYLLTGEDSSVIETFDPIEQEIMSLVHQLPRAGKEKVRIFITGLNEGISVAAEDAQNPQRMAK